MTDNESGCPHARLCADTKEACITKGVCVAKNTYTAFCLNNCAVPSLGGYGTYGGASISGMCVRIKGWVCTFKSPRLNASLYLLSMYIWYTILPLLGRCTYRYKEPVDTVVRVSSLHCVSTSTIPRHIHGTNTLSIEDKASHIPR